MVQILLSKIFSEGADHCNAKTKIGQEISKNECHFFDFKSKESFKIENPAFVVHEYFWFKKAKSSDRRDPISFRADIAVLGEDYKLICVIEVCDSCPTSSKKVIFYKSMNLVWIEISALSILNSPGVIFEGEIHNFTKIDTNLRVVKKYNSLFYPGIFDKESVRLYEELSARTNLSPRQKTHQIRNYAQKSRTWAY